MQLRLGIDVACREFHQAALADETGRILWSGHRLLTTTQHLDALWSKLLRTARRISGNDSVDVLVVMEPTRNAWVPLAAWLRGRGAIVNMVPPEQSSDLRRYYNKHAKTDRLDCELLARLPLLHPGGLKPTPGLGPAESLRRATGHRTSLVQRRTRTLQRVEALLELLGPWWTAALGTSPSKTGLLVLERYANPHDLLRLGRARLTRILAKSSRGIWGQQKADELLSAAQETLLLWSVGGLDLAELADDIAAEVHLINQLDTEIDNLDDRIAGLYASADPTGIVRSAPGIADVLAPTILGRLGDPDRFDNLAAIRNYTGLVPKVDQSGLSDRHGGPTKAGDAVLRHALFCAADQARKVDPSLALRYKRLRDTGRHHNSALCTIGAVLITRIAACWRTKTHYQLRDLTGAPITDDQGRRLCRTIRPEPASKTGRRSKESQSAPSTGPSENDATTLASSA